MKKKCKTLIAILLSVIVMTQFSYTANAGRSIQKGEWSWAHKNKYDEYVSATIHYMKTTPDRLTLREHLDNLDNCSYDNAINASFFNRITDEAMSIALVNDMAVTDGGDIQVEDHIRAAFVYDKKAEEIPGDEAIGIQLGIETKYDISVYDRRRYLAVGGIEWGGQLNGGSTWTQRTALVHDRDGYVYLIATEDGIRQADWEEAIEYFVDDFADGLHLDGGGSSQMRYDGQMVVDSSRKVPVIITVD